MSKRITRSAGLLFLAASSVYAMQALAAKPQGGAGKPLGVKGTDVRVLENFEDPFAAAPTSQPSGESEVQGTSVTADMVSVNDEGTVEIHVNDAALVEVLRMLSLQSRKNIIASKEVNGKVTANLYGVTVREALDAILAANGFAYREKGNFIYVYTAKEIAELEKASRVTQTEVFRLFYTPAGNAVNMIKPVLSEAAQVSFSTPAVAGIASGASDVGGDSHATQDVIVVTDYAENLEKARKIIKEVDRRPQQILIEATILRAALSEDNALGVDFNVLSGVSFSNILSNAAGQITGGNLGDSNPQPTVGSVGTGNSFTSGVNGGLKVGFVFDNISVFLAALEGVTDTTVLANPKVLALNKQKGEVIVGRKDGYLTTTVTESSTVQTVEFLDTGTRLIFRPFIGDDGYVRMEIHPEDSSGGLTADNLPFKITTEVTSNVMVKDGHTIVIGGLFREASDSSKSQVPGLGNIPLAGMLFRNQRDRTVREEIIILLTPHIVKDDVAFSEASEEQLKEIDKLRVGVRKGMMPWGRERLAECFYEQAAAELGSGAPDRDKALFFLNCATNLNPKFREAILMKEEVTGRILTSSDNSSVRSFIRRQVLADRNRPAPTTLPASVPITATESNNQPTIPAQPALLQTRLDSPASQPATNPSRRVMVEVPTGAATALPAEHSESARAAGGTSPAHTGKSWMDWLTAATNSAKLQSAPAASGAAPVHPVSGPTTQPSHSGTFTELPMAPEDDRR